MWEYKVQKIDRVIDGDTVDAVIDLGFYNYRLQRFRVWGINAPEMTGDTKEAGESAKKFVEDWFAKNSFKEIRVQTFKDGLARDGFGRWIGDFFSVDQGLFKISLSDELVDKGIAEPFMDKGYYTGLTTEKKV